MCMGIVICFANKTYYIYRTHISKDVLYAFLLRFLSFECLSLVQNKEDVSDHVEDILDSKDKGELERDILDSQDKGE